MKEFDEEVETLSLERCASRRRWYLGEVFLDVETLNLVRQCIPVLDFSERRIIPRKFSKDKKVENESEIPNVARGREDIGKVGGEEFRSEPLQRAC